MDSRETAAARLMEPPRSGPESHAAARQGGHGTLQQALDHTMALLAADPALALTQAQEILRHVPGHPQALLLEAMAHRLTGDLAGARARLVPLARQQPRAAAVALELGITAAALGEMGLAAQSLRQAARLKPDLAPAWGALARCERTLGNLDEAATAELNALRASSRDPLLIKAALAMTEGHFEAAQALLRGRLATDPHDFAALRMLGELAWRQGHLDEAIDLLFGAVRLGPAFASAREFLARLLTQANRLPEALEQARALTQAHPDIPDPALLLASLMTRTGDQHGARAIYETLLIRDPAQPMIWMNLGHVRKTIGDQAGAVAAYRRAIALSLTLGEAWWSLANLKTVQLGVEDIAAMEQGLERAATDEDRFHLHFALGKALEDMARDEAAFAHYALGNRMRRLTLPYDAQDNHREAQEHGATFTAPFYAARAGEGCMARDPIFVLGMPRSGSTLVEQILSSHSRIEGTHELPEMMMLAGRLQSRVEDGEFASYGVALASLSATDRRRLGEEYIDRTRVHRQSDRPHFIDKMPNNWQNVGLIHLILPHARIIDTRRHPMGCCFSGWKQHFARGQAFSYDLADIGHYYRDYVEQMAAFDAQCPGVVHRVIYEDMVADTPGEVARLLAWLDLPFEEECLSFWRNRRAVRTASSEQVRQPIYTAGLDHWQRFEPWLSPLAEALGPVLTGWRG
jgi:tetratricopeptide (TPR) repeat protein